MKRRNIFISTALVVAAVTGAHISRADAAAFTNGSFELPAIAPNSIVTVPAGSTQISGWTNHGPGQVYWIHGTAGGQQPGPLADSQYINFNADNTPPGTAISQSFDTFVGYEYVVNFRVGRGGAASGTISITASVRSDTGQLLASLQGFPPGSIGWNSLLALRFIATTPTTTLRFEDTSIDTFDTDVVLDGVMVDPVSSVAQPVPLQQATATFSQEADGGFTIDKAIDDTLADNKGWSISPVLGAQTAVFETVTDVGFLTGSRLTFVLYQYHSNPQHTLGRFRLSVTTDNRTNFADGLVTGGDVTANWFVLVPESTMTTQGTVLSVLPDGSVLASGPSPAFDLYVLTARTFMTGITGVRLEALTDPSLPNNGPGRRSENGNFCLSYFGVAIEPRGYTVVNNVITQIVTNMITQVITNTVSLVTLRADVASSGVTPRAMRALNRELQLTEKRLQKLGNAASRRIGPVNNELAEKIRADIQVLIGEADQ